MGDTKCTGAWISFSAARAAGRGLLSIKVIGNTAAATAAARRRLLSNNFYRLTTRIDIVERLFEDSEESDADADDGADVGDLDQDRYYKAMEDLESDLDCAGSPMARYSRTLSKTGIAARRTIATAISSIPSDCRTRRLFGIGQRSD